MTALAIDDVIRIDGVEVIAVLRLDHHASILPCELRDAGSSVAFVTSPMAERFEPNVEHE